MHDNIGRLPSSIVRSLADVLWRSSRVSRSRMNHGTRPCQQRHSSLNPASADDTVCDLCTELHLIHLHVVAGRLTRKGLSAQVECDQYARKNWEHSLLEARDLLHGQSGLLVRPTRLTDRAWFITALPDAVDQELIIDVIYFLRSGDQPGRSCGSPLPIERLAERFGLTAEDCRRRITRALTMLTEQRPEFVRNNIDRPLSARLPMAEAPDWEHLDRANEVEVEDVDDGRSTTWIAC